MARCIFAFKIMQFLLILTCFIFIFFWIMPSKRCHLSILGRCLALREINIVISLFLLRNVWIIDGDRVDPSYFLIHEWSMVKMALQVLLPMLTMSGVGALKTSPYPTYLPSRRHVISLAVRYSDRFYCKSHVLYLRVAKRQEFLPLVCFFS